MEKGQRGTNINFNQTHFQTFKNQYQNGAVDSKNFNGPSQTNFGLNSDYNLNYSLDRMDAKIFNPTLI